jgi:hypothetical protein
LARYGIDQAVWLLFSEILMLIHVSVLFDYFTGYVCAYMLDIAAQHYGELYGLASMPLFFGYLQKSKIISWKRREFEDL